MTNNKLEQLILMTCRQFPNRWLNCSGGYIGEVLALQCKGLVESRVIETQLQVRAKRDD